MLGLMTYQVMYVAPTGKAASVLRSKGCLANTIHKTFYTIHKTNGKLYFNKKKNISVNIKLIVIDEVSMVNDKMMDDIISYGVPILVMGDDAQLPPIFGSNRFITMPDITLTEVVRQGALSGILQLATMARNGEHIPLGTYKESNVINSNMIKDIEKYDMILCWKNKTRRELNNLIRKKLGHTSELPEIGEKIICLRNNYNYMIEYDKDIPIFLVNGMSCTALSDSKLLTEDTFDITFKPDFVKNELKFNGPCDRNIFTGNIPDEDDTLYTDEDSKNIISLDFGYALTSYKSQGSQACNVLVMDEFKCGDALYKKHLYTSITRAIDRVTLAYCF